jgi:DNA modification methylase
MNCTGGLRKTLDRPYKNSIDTTDYKLQFSDQAKIFAGAKKQRAPFSVSDNTLYYGDNLDILRRYVKDETVDLIYLDPPFKSNQDYNVLFAEQDGSRAAAQIMAFEDTWRWDESAARAFHEVIEQGGKVSDVMRAFHTFLGGNDMMAYLAMMAPRLVELRRVLKPTGSIYLHCDPTASHYLKLLMDAVFGRRWLSEIIWKRTSAHSSSKRCGPVHDTLLHYANGERYVWNDLKIAHDPKYIEGWFRHVDRDSGRKFKARDLTGAGVRHGDSGKAWRGTNPTDSGRHWAVPNSLMKRLGLNGASIQERLDVLDAAGLIYWPKKENGIPQLKWFADELQGATLPDVWTDIPPIGSQAAERLGYPTQKPEALIERIIQASSNEDDVVLDPFCGCGTAIAVAHKLNQQWIGIDITHLAMTLIKKRLFDSFGKDVKYKLVGEPVDLSGAKKLAADDKYQFQWWALGLVKARPVDQKKGADQGIDGRRYFLDHMNRTYEQIIFSVKGGHTNAAHVRDLRGVIEREKAAIGVLITLEKATAPMKKEAADAGYYTSKWRGQKHLKVEELETQHPRIQLISIAELLKGRQLNLPALANVPTLDATFKKAPKAKGKKKGNEEMEL